MKDYGNEMVLVVPKRFLTKDKYKYEDVVKLIDYYSVFRFRNEVELDFDLRQIIPYCILKCGDKYFATKRLAGDPRLTGGYSIGTGGHVNKEDVNPKLDATTINNCIIRELTEETTLTKKDLPKEFKFVESFVDNSNEVSQVHLCLLYLVEVNKECKIKETDKLEGLWLSKEELTDEIYNSFESWSKIAADIIGFKPIKKRATKNTKSKSSTGTKKGTAK